MTLASRTLRLVGVPACWGIFQQLAPTHLGTRVARYGGLAFFLLLAHYAASVAVTVTVVMAAGVLLARLKPDWFALMNGGRLAFTSPPQRDRHKPDTGAVTVDGRPTASGNIRYELMGFAQ